MKGVLAPEHAHSMQSQLPLTHYHITLNVVRPAVHANKTISLIASKHTINTITKTHMRDTQEKGLTEPVQNNYTEKRAGGIKTTYLGRWAHTFQGKNPACKKPFLGKKWLGNNPNKNSSQTANTHVGVWLVLGHPFFAISETDLKENNTKFFYLHCTGWVGGNSTTRNCFHALALEWLYDHVAGLYRPPATCDLLHYTTSGAYFLSNSWRQTTSILFWLLFDYGSLLCSLLSRWLLIKIEQRMRLIVYLPWANTGRADGANIWWKTSNFDQGPFETWPW